MELDTVRTFHVCIGLQNDSSYGNAKRLSGLPLETPGSYKGQDIRIVDAGGQNPNTTGTSPKRMYDTTKMSAMPGGYYGNKGPHHVGLSIRKKVMERDNGALQHS